MSQPFTFPPPPPPPPSRGTQAQSFSQSSRGNSRGRGGPYGHQPSGRGRGQHGTRGNYNQHRGSITNSQYQSRTGPPTQFQQEQQSPQKRPYSNAFRGNTEENIRSSRPKAPPAVPSYGANFDSLLAAKPMSHQSVSLSASQPIAGNLLGLTPAAAAESDSESDVDDESKLAAAFSDPDALHFEYQGQTATLNTPEEIAAWIAERRKKWPTEEKREVARKQAQEQKAKLETQKAERLAAAKAKARIRDQERLKRNLEKEKSTIRQNILRQHIQNAKTTSEQNEHKSVAQLKIERLRRKSEKAAKQLSSADKAVNSANEEEQLDELIAQVDEAAAAQQPIAAPKLVSIGLSDVSSSEDDIEDTSSSGSSDFQADSDSAPEETSSKSTGPIRVHQTPRAPVNDTEDTRPPCRTFSATGSCKYGRKCRFKHVKPVKEHVSKPGDRRKGLYQILVEKEQAEERNMALKTIIAMGDAGLLDPLPATEPSQLS